MQKRQDSKQCKFVSFSGIDGAGKSTQIANLRGRLQNAGMRVALITFWDDVARLKRIREGAGHTLFKGEKGVGSPEKPVNRRDKNVRSWPMSLVRLGLYFVDALSLRATVTKALRSGADFVICDRYIYDELANLNLGNPAARAYVRMIMELVPRPDVSYFLDADPVAARARKPEYPLDFLYMSRASYFTLIRLIGGITVIPPMPIQDAEREVMHHALALLSSDERHNRPAEHLVSER
ncbi:MAG TPA: thymidylate kinase [Acidobacteriaceae bacterium]|nr:thymidylate kinase [Acidobacteriaceae bacterium]